MNKIHETSPQTQPALLLNSGETNAIKSDICQDQVKTVHITDIVFQVRSGPGPGHLPLLAWILWSRPGAGLVQAGKMMFIPRPRPGRNHPDNGEVQICIPFHYQYTATGGNMNQSNSIILKGLLFQEGKVKP